MTQRPDIALCISGQLRDDHLHLPGIAQLARRLGATVFISTWRKRGRKTSGPTNRDQLIRMFGYATGSALPAAVVDGSRFNEAVPDYEKLVLEKFQQDVVTATYLQSHFPGATVDIEDETVPLSFPAPKPPDSNSLRMLYKVWRCNELKREAERKRGRLFDVVVRIRPDIMPVLDADVFAKVLDRQDPPVALFHNGKPDATYLDDVIMVSNSEVADRLATLFDVARQHPERIWGLIHHEIPRHLQSQGVVAGSVALEKWVTEDTTIGPPENRRLLLDLIEQGRVNPAVFPNQETWSAVNGLLRAAAMVDDRQPSQLVEQAIGAIALERQDVDFLARTAFVLGRTHQAAQRSTDRVATCAAEALCAVIADGPKVLSQSRLLKELGAMASLARGLGISEPLTWRALQRALWQNGPDPGLRRLLNAMAATLTPAQLLEAERAVAAACPEVPALPEPIAAGLAAAADAWARGDDEAALVALRAISASHPDHYRPYAWCGDIHFRAGDLGAALASYAQASGKPGAPADMSAMLSVCLETLGNGRNATVAARRAVTIAGDNTTFLRRLASRLASDGQHADAMQVHQNVARRIGDIAAMPAAAAAEKDPRLTVGPIADVDGSQTVTPIPPERDDHMSGMGKDMPSEQIVAAAASSVDTTEFKTADDLLKVGVARLQARDVAIAHELANACLERFPNHLAGYLFACEVARVREDRGDADAIMLRAIALFPTHEWAYAYYAYNALRVRDFEIAAARYYDAHTRFPNFSRAAKGLAESLAELKLGALATAVLDSAIRSGPPDMILFMARAKLAADANDWNAVAGTARRMLEQFSSADVGSELGDLIARIPSTVDEAARRDVYAVMVRMPVATEAAFDKVLDLALGLDDVPGALAHWTKHAWRWERSAKLDQQAAKMLRAALVAAVPAADVERLVDYLLTQPPAPSTAWYPTLLDVAVTLRRAENSALFQRLADWVLPAIERLPARGPVSYFVQLVLAPNIPYEGFEALMDQALPVMAAHNLWVKLFDRAVRSIEDARRYIRRYVDAGYPLAPSQPIAGLEGLDAARCMFLVANARDPESAEILLQRFRALEPNDQAEIGSWEAVVPQIASRFILNSDPPAAVRRVGDRLKIGVCVSGQLRGFRDAHPSWSHLGWDAHDVTVAVHTWRNIGRRFPDNTAQLDRAFSPTVRDALIQVSALVGYNEILRRYPSLFNIFRQKNNVQLEDLRDVYGADLIEIEDDDRAPFSRMQNQEKMYYKVEKCHDLLMSSGERFDLIFRMRPDKAFLKPSTVDWGRIYYDSTSQREIYADVGPFLVMGYGYCIGDQFAVGGVDAMQCYAHTWRNALDPRLRSAGWLPPMPLAHTSFAYAAVLGGVRVKSMEGVHFGGLITEDVLTPAQVRSLLLTDMDGSPRDDIDRTLLAACDG